MTNRRVLLVDPDAASRAALAALLARDGYVVDLAADVGEALARLRLGPPPRIVLLDLYLPGEDGWTFLRLRRRDPALARIPVVVVSAHAGPTRVSPYVGVAAVIARPAVPAAVLDAVVRYGRDGADDSGAHAH